MPDRIHPLEHMVWDVLAQQRVIDTPIIAVALGYQLRDKTPSRPYFTVARSVLDHMVRAGRLTRDAEGWYVPARSEVIDVPS